MCTYFFMLKSNSLWPLDCWKMLKLAPNPHAPSVTFAATRRQENCGAKTNVGSVWCIPFVNKSFGEKVKLVTPARNPLTSNPSSMAPYFNVEFTFDAWICPCSKNNVGQISNFFRKNELAWGLTLIFPVNDPPIKSVFVSKSVFHLCKPVFYTCCPLPKPNDVWPWSNRFLLSDRIE